jgi:RNA-splicing ligase RtcB
MSLGTLGGGNHFIEIDSDETHFHGSGRNTWPGHWYGELVY